MSRTHSETDMHCQHHIEPWWPYSGRGHRDPTPGSLALEINHLQFRYSGSTTPAIMDASLQVARQQRVALIGPNGAIVLSCTLLFGVVFVSTRLVRISSPTAH